MKELRRLVLEFKAEELVIRALYRSSLDAPNPGTKARARIVVELARSGLQDAFEALDAGDVAMCGTSGFTQREDLLSVALPRPHEASEAAS